jgi:hypothetical protein
MVAASQQSLSTMAPTVRSAATSARSAAQGVPAVSSHEIGQAKTTFHFEGQILDGQILDGQVFDGQVDGMTDPCLSPAKQNEFTADFCRELARLEQWAAAQHWPPCDVRELQVFVSDRFRISKSLVPAWYGRAGRMEFPAWRIVARKAAIAHELVHVFFPNGNRFLAEGLAVHLQAEIGGNPAFPNFGRPLHELVRELLREMVPEFAFGDQSSLDEVDLAELDKIATPSPLELKVGPDFYGEEPRGQAHIYPIAGSFVRFLIETHGMEKFRGLYLQTPLKPLQLNAGTADRWIGVYGLSRADLEAQWKSLLGNAVSRPRSIE